MIFLLILILLAAAFVIFCICMTNITFKVTYRRFAIDRENNLLYLYDEKYKDKYPMREVSFPSGDETLRGYILGEYNDKALAVFSHGIWSGPEEYLPIMTYLVDRGYRVFAYDYTGYDKSTGESAKGLPQSPLDLHAALSYIESDPELSKLKKCILGHSWGGYASTAVLNFDHDVTAACAMSGFNDPYTISVETSKGMLGPVIGSCMGPFIRRKNQSLFGKYGNLSATDGINKANIPVLITHADHDDFIGYETSSIICHKDEITNPKVEYVTITEEPRNNHNDFFLSVDSAKATQEFRAGYAKIEKEFGKGLPPVVPAEKKRSYYATADKERCNQPSPEYFALVADFFDRAL